MAYINCKNQNIDFCEIEKHVLDNITELPWRHKSCQVTDVSNCNKNWKPETPIYALVPTMSRPIPQIRSWCAPGRPLPIINSNSNFSINGGMIDPITGNYLTDIQYNGQSINLSDYLHYNNPNVKINSKGKIACADEEGTYQQNFYSGPGWKSSRVHGRTKNTALPRPIKHWRRQLFPRQYIDQEGQPLPDLPIDQTNIDTNKITRGRHYSGLNLFESPNGYTITKIKILQDSVRMLDNNNNIIGGRAISCKPVWVIDTNIDIADDTSNCSIVNKRTTFTIPQCAQRSALIRARPGSFVKKGFFQYESNKGYLQSRAALNYQVSIFSYTPYLYNKNLNNPSVSNERFKQILYQPNTFPPSTFSLYRNNQSIRPGFIISEIKTCYNVDSDINIYSTPSERCLCKRSVSYKPSNIIFQRNSAVQSSSNIKRKARAAITRKQYNITNMWGITTSNSSLYTPCYLQRTTINGTTKCYNKNNLRYPYGR
jgi:hypothetical protein